MSESVTTLRELIERYTKHTDECAVTVMAEFYEAGADEVLTLAGETPLCNCGLADALQLLAEVDPPVSRPLLSVVSQAMDALESDAELDQRKTAWNALRDAFYPVKSGDNPTVVPNDAAETVSRPLSETETLKFFVDDRGYETRHTTLTAMEIKAVANVPLNSRLAPEQIMQLFKAGANIFLADDEPIDLTGESKRFYSVPQAYASGPVSEPVALSRPHDTETPRRFPHGMNADDHEPTCDIRTSRDGWDADCTCSTQYPVASPPSPETPK